jgi:VanZ family protein
MNNIFSIKYLRDLVNYWFPPIIWMIIIFPTNDYLSSKNTSNIIIPLILIIFPDIDNSILNFIHFIIRKMFHFFNYLFLAFLLYRAFTKGRKTWYLKGMIITVIISAMYAIMDELIQTIIPSRTGTFYDFIIDISGCVFLFGIVYLKYK